MTKRALAARKCSIQAMQPNFIVAGLALLHEVITRHIAQDAAKLLLLCGLTMFAVACGIAAHFTQARIGHFRHAVSKVIIDASLLHKSDGLALTEVEVLCQPSPHPP
jgi:hypothetical protein